MGLKTTNYEVKGLGITLPEAYAKLKKLKLLEDNTVIATFVVQETREKISKLEPLETCSVKFLWDRKTDLAEMAYEASKKVTETNFWDKNTYTKKTIYNKAPFFGWENDIL